MSLSNKVKKSISQPVSVRESVSTSTAITDSAAFSAACIYSTVEDVRESLPEGFYSMKVRMSASSSQAGPIGEGTGKWLTVLSVHISCVFAVIFNIKEY